MAELSRFYSMHTERRWALSDMLLGLQLTHSGRLPPSAKIGWSRIFIIPFDGKFGLDSDFPLMEDSYIDDLVGHYVRAAKLAGSRLSICRCDDCHGYLGHEFALPAARTLRRFV